MTVAELIEALNTIDDKSQRVVISGYEGGYKDVTEVELITIVLNVNTVWYYGAHEELCPFTNTEGKEIVTAIKLWGY